MEGLDSLCEIERGALKNIAKANGGSKEFYKKDDFKIENGHVVALFLREKGLKTLHPDINKLKEIKYIELSDNNLEFLPQESIEELMKLPEMRIDAIKNNFDGETRKFLEKMQEKYIWIYY